MADTDRTAPAVVEEAQGSTEERLSGIEEWIKGKIESLGDNAKIVYFCAVLGPLALMVFGAWVQSQFLHLAGIVISIFVTLSHVVFGPTLLWITGLIFPQTRDAVAFVLTKAVLAILYWQCIVFIFALMFDTHLWGVRELVLTMVLSVLLAVGTPLRPGQGGFGFFIEGFYFVAEMMFLWMLAFALDTIGETNILPRLKTNVIDQIVMAINFSIEGFSGWQFQWRQFLGSFIVVIFFMTLAHWFRSKITQRMGENGAEAVSEDSTLERQKSAFNIKKHFRAPSGTGVVILGLAFIAVWLFDGGAFALLASSGSILLMLAFFALLLLFSRSAPVWLLSFMMIALIWGSSSQIAMAQLPSDVAGRLQEGRKAVVGVGDDLLDKAKDRLSSDSGSTTATATTSAETVSLNLRSAKVCTLLAHQRGADVYFLFAESGETVRRGQTITRTDTGGGTLLVGIRTRSGLYGKKPTSVGSGGQFVAPVSGELVVWVDIDPDKRPATAAIFSIE